MGLSTSAQTPEVTTTDEMPLTENMSKEEENISKEEEEMMSKKPADVMETMTTLPTLSSFGDPACCHQGLAR